MKTNSARRKSPPGRRPATSAAPHRTLSASQPVTSIHNEPVRATAWRRHLPGALVCAALATALVILCAARLAAFPLLPLDAPGTLHAILWPLFKRLQLPYSSLEAFAPVWVLRGQILLFLPFAVILLSFVPLRPTLRRVFGSRILFWVAIAACLLYWRFPLLLGGATNVDEAEFSVSATKLLSDPVFFRTTNVSTSGPLNIFPLALPALFGFSPDYSTARVIALVVIFLTLFFLYRALSEMSSDVLARVAILPALGFFSLASFGDFLTYSAELIPMLLTALAVLACGRVIRRPGNSARPILALGFLVSAAFFAKMQSVPIMAAAAVFGAVVVWRSREMRPWWRPVLLLAAGFAPLQLLNLGIAVAAGVVRESSVGYLAGNARFSRSTGQWTPNIPDLVASLIATTEMQFLVLILLALAAVTLYAALRGDRERSLLRLAGCAVVAAAAFFGLTRVQSLLHSPTSRTLGIVIAVAALGAFAWLTFRRIFGIFALALVGATLFAIYLSPQKYPHYTELLIVPISTLIGWLLMRQGPRLSTVVVALAVIAAAETTLFHGVRRNLWEAHQHTALAGGSLIRSLTHAGPTVVIWGWRPELLLSAGRIPATRESNYFYNGTEPERVLQGLTRARPELIVDALDVSCCVVLERKHYGFQAVPAIDEFVRANYSLVAEEHQQRFYLRKDLSLPSEPQRERRP
uniref:Glycosyltransferase RgtA/B/C/D-like domain-containing protein n=1 Tax=Solibacter usitatus (strain Ellin6076) TaxID=234267 RepID=Q029U0_SOLUE